MVAVSPGRRAGLSPPLIWEVGRACSSPLCCGGSSGHRIASSREELFGRGSAHQSHHRGLRGPLPAHREPSPGWPTLYGVSGGAAQRPLGFELEHIKSIYENSSAQVSSPPVQQAPSSAEHSTHTGQCWMSPRYIMRRLDGITNSVD